jgi:transposase InsO family protein
MPWREMSVVEQRRELVQLAAVAGVNRRALFRGFGVSAKTGYKWLARAQIEGAELGDRSRRPHASPQRSGVEIEQAVLAVRDAHPAWGARKIASYLRRGGTVPPAASTVHAILRRHGRIVSPAAGRGPAPLRFERPAPNQLWQMDFKGWMALANQHRCHPLTMIDDHSRYALALKACADQRRGTVQETLVATFRRYGLPDAIIVDNGSPWGDTAAQGWTRLAVWLVKLGIEVLHSRPYHPQTRGKNERFHRTLDAEVLALRRFRDLDEVQRAFDSWREVYNFERPHEALEQTVPCSRYVPSTRPMPEALPTIEYASSEIVRRVGTTKTYISFKGRLWKLPQAFAGERLALRPRGPDGNYALCFGARPIATLDLTTNTIHPVTYLSEHPSPISPG